MDESFGRTDIHIQTPLSAHTGTPISCLPQRVERTSCTTLISKPVIFSESTFPRFSKTMLTLSMLKHWPSSYQDYGQLDQALLVLSNISHNLLAQQSPEAQSTFDFSLAEDRNTEGKFPSCPTRLWSHTPTDTGQIGALARIQTIALRVQSSKPRTSALLKDDGSS